MLFIIIIITTFIDQYHVLTHSHSKEMLFKGTECLPSKCEQRNLSFKCVCFALNCRYFSSYLCSSMPWIAIVLKWMQQSNCILVKGTEKHHVSRGIQLCWGKKWSPWHEETWPPWLHSKHNDQHWYYFNQAKSHDCVNYHSCKKEYIISEMNRENWYAHMNNIK